MIKIINGVLGGGKTCLAVSYIYSLVPNKIITKPIVDDKDYDGDYKKVYTNISGFKGDDFYIPVEFLNFDILDKCALVMYLLLENNRHIQSIDSQMNLFFDQVADRVPFDKLVCDLDLETAEVFYDEIIGFRFNRVLFAIDEFADYFKDKKEHLIKWFNWSRHLYQDMVLIQNDITDVARSYKNDKTVKNYIQAADAENRWHPSLFKYAYFRKPLQPKNGIEYFKNIWIPKWIFTKYESGKKHIAFPKIYKYLIFFISILLLLFYLVLKVLSISDDTPGQTVNDHPPGQTVNDHPPEQIVKDYSSGQIEKPSSHRLKIDNRGLACFKCSNDVCLYKNDIYSIDRIESTISVYDFKLAYSINNPLFSEYCYFSNKAFFKQYEKPVIKRVASPKLGSFGMP